MSFNLLCNKNEVRIFHEKYQTFRISYARFISEHSAPLRTVLKNAPPMELKFAAKYRTGNKVQLQKH